VQIAEDRFINTEQTAILEDKPCHSIVLGMHLTAVVCFVSLPNYLAKEIFYNQYKLAEPVLVI
jgi:hypothetical protein